MGRDVHALPPRQSIGVLHNPKQLAETSPEPPALMQIVPGSQVSVWLGDPLVMLQLSPRVLVPAGTQVGKPVLSTLHF
jgi:hypothetical protein